MEFLPESAQGILILLKILAVAVALVMLAFMAFVVLRTQWIYFRVLFDLGEFFTFRPYGVKRVTKEWEKLQGRLSSASEPEYKLAVLEADRMLDETLSRLNIPGQNLRERLSATTIAVIPNMKEVEEATQTRNNIVHDPDYHLSLADARRVLAAYEETFKHLDLL